MKKWLFLWVLFVIIPEISAQWIPGYSFRKKITINHAQVSGSVDLIDYPLLFSTIDPELKSTAYGGFVHSPDGWDICFSASDGLTPLDHEIDVFTAATGEIVVWIRLPLLSPATDTDIYMYYGNPAIVSDPSTVQTWSTDYRGVWHLNDLVQDASQFSNHAIEYGSQMPALGKIGAARYFDGLNDYLHVVNDSSLNFSEGICIEGWINIANVAQPEWALLTKNYDYSITYFEGKLVFHAGDLNFEYIVSFNQNTWYYISATYDRLFQRLYINGNEVASIPNTIPISNDFNGLVAIARLVNKNAYDFIGNIDEVKLSSVSRSADWIKTSYNNQNRPDLFSSYSINGAINDLPCDAIILPVNPTCSFQTFSNLDATDSGVSLTECNDGYSGGDVWFKAEVPANGSLLIKIETDAIARFPNNDGWAYRIGLAVYSGFCNSLTQETCWLDPLSMGLPTSPEILLQGYNPGDTLLLRMWERLNDDNGKFRICITSDDEENPSISCPEDIMVTADSDTCSANVSVSIPVAEDNYGIESVLNDYNGTGDASDFYPVGTTVVEWTATDINGNTAVCSFSITVTDDQAPVISCPADITEYLDSNCAFSLPDYTALVQSDDHCDTVFSIIQFPTEGTLISGAGSTQQITISAEDRSNNISECQFNITLQDTISPTLSCPADITEYLDSNCEFSLPDYTGLVQFSDNCDPEQLVIQTPPVGTILSSSGTVQEIVLSAQDIHGNESECRFDLTLLDNTPPDVLSIKDTSVFAEEGVYEIFVAIPAPVFYDNCGILSVENDFNGGADASGNYPFGSTTVAYTVTDINNNTAQFYQVVILSVIDEPENGLVIPEAFSPNEDGLNDRFEILGIEQYPQNELQVFNVYGIEVFRMENYDNSWDGIPHRNQDNGNKLPTGTYYYVLRLDGQNEIIKGFVYLRRE